MKIKYIPEVIDGKQRQSDIINKYGYNFEKGETVEVPNPALAAKMLKAPYFVNDEEDLILAEKPKKRGRPAKQTRIYDA